MTTRIIFKSMQADAGCYEISRNFKILQISLERPSLFYSTETSNYASVALGFLSWQLKLSCGLHLRAASIKKVFLSLDFPPTNIEQPLMTWVRYVEMKSAAPFKEWFTGNLCFSYFWEGKNREMQNPRCSRNAVVPKPRDVVKNLYWGVPKYCGKIWNLWWTLWICTQLYISLLSWEVTIQNWGVPWNAWTTH